MSKPNAGLWIPKEILANKDLTHIEKIIWSMSLAMPKGLRMADSTIADQTGTSPKNVAKVLAKMVASGWLQKSGSHYTRSFRPITPQGVIETTPTVVIEKTDYPSGGNQLPLQGKSITPQGVHKVYKRIRKNKDGEDFIFEEAEISPEQRKQNLLDQHRWAIQNGLIKSK